MPLSNANGCGISYKNPVKGIVSLIEKGNAHATLDDALNNTIFAIGSKARESTVQHLAGCRTYSYCTMGHPGTFTKCRTYLARMAQWILAKGRSPGFRRCLAKMY